LPTFYDNHLTDFLDLELQQLEPASLPDVERPAGLDAA
jgi:hypothetical protein